MAFTIGNFTYISKKERLELSSDLITFIEIHEAEHRRRWREAFWVFGLAAIQKEERICQRLAYEKMLTLGYSLDQIDDLELSFRLWRKYGLKSLEEYKKIMRGEKYDC